MSPLECGKVSTTSPRQPESVNIAIFEHVSTTEESEWEFARLGQDLYRFFDIFNEAFFNGKLTTPILSLDSARIRTGGTYRIGRNGFGAKNYININRRHLDLPMVIVLAILLHEQIHQWQHEITKNYGKPPYHNVEFYKKADELGIPGNKRNKRCQLLGMKAPFLTVCEAHGIDTNGVVIQPPPESEMKGQSKLKKWSCGCTNVRVAVADFQAVCLKCRRKFKRA